MIHVRIEYLVPIDHFNDMVLRHIEKEESKVRKENLIERRMRKGKGTGKKNMVNSFINIIKYIGYL